VTPERLGQTDYLQYCAWLGIQPDEALSPTAREAAIPRWLRGPSISTIDARYKLLAWARRTPRAEWLTPLEPAVVLTTQQHIGDELLAHSIARTIAALPRPMGDYVLDRVVTVSIGARMTGFCAPPLGFDDRCWLVVVSSRGDDVEYFKSVCVHEFCHAWLLPEPAPGVVCSPSFFCDTVENFPLHQVPPDALAPVTAHRQRKREREDECRALVKFLGYRDPHDWPSSGANS